MQKTLTISIEDIEQANTIQVSGTLHAAQFNDVVILSVGTAKVPVNSRDLQAALNEVVTFQSKFEVKGE